MSLRYNLEYLDEASNEIVTVPFKTFAEASYVGHKIVCQTNLYAYIKAVVSGKLKRFYLVHPPDKENPLGKIVEDHFKKHRG